LEALRRDSQAQNAAASIITPEIGERYLLPAGAPAKRVATGRTELREAIGQDWQNDYARFATGLKRQLAEMESAAARREALARMRAVLDSFRGHRSRQHAPRR
jgi:metallo-beta-lactamase family protein